MKLAIAGLILAAIPTAAFAGERDHRTGHSGVSIRVDAHEQSRYPAVWADRHVDVRVDRHAAPARYHESYASDRHTGRPTITGGPRTAATVGTGTDSGAVVVGDQNFERA